MNEHRERMFSDHRPGGDIRGFAGGMHRDSGSRFSAGFHADFGAHRPSYLHARYYDRPDLIRYSDHHIHMYYDPYNRLHHRVIWPSYYYPVCYSFGPYYGFHYVWPYYHRKYVFVSLGGWWPDDYSYMRYYWYGWHPYVWYGYYPVAREVVVGGGDYYTYNNYYGDDGSYTTGAPLDPVTEARMRAQLEQQKAVEPAAATLADTRFEEGVKSFEAGDYAAAAAKFSEARRMSPQDMILPYAYAQALFAEEQYGLAADVLRTALQNVSPEKDGVFFPRGLYANDDVLFAQIEKLTDKVDQAQDNSDLQLLLGYQLMGVGETGYAREVLEDIAQDPKNAVQARILLQTLDKMEKEAGSAVQTGGEAAQKATTAPKTEPPTATTLGEMMSTAAQPSAAPKASGESVPPVPAGETPVVTPQEKPSGDNKESAAPAGLSSAALPQDPKPPAQNNDQADSVGSGDIGTASAAVEEAGLAASPAGWTSGLSRLLGPRVPNFKMDVTIFASIVSLAVAGVWIEWRMLGRTPA